jgi:D-alanine--D-alanine ligase
MLYLDKFNNVIFINMKVAILCGGPSLERGISLNSARSVLDHLSSDLVEIYPIYFNNKRQAFKVSKAQLYCNTPSDFDFKLDQTASPLTQGSLIKFFKSVDVVFPVMHGSFGEDGEIQRYLEKNKIPFVGSGSTACRQAFDKYEANEFIKRNNFFVLPSVILKIFHKDHQKIIEDFFQKYRITRAIVKPASGGSSIGVFSVNTPEEAWERATYLFSRRMDSRVVIEPFCTGTEFTVIILENRFGLPVALPPTEIETDYTKNQIFDFRKKYLPTRQVTWHCPPRFDNKTIDKIQAQAEQLFALFGMHDFARFDGWILPNGELWFCDFNPISGMEQNSFLFQQSSRVGFTHSDVLQHVLQSACRRYQIPFPGTNHRKDVDTRRPVNIIFGGNNSERQVSLMSGTNIWLKLRASKKYRPIPHLLDKKGEVWCLPYQLALNHTVEEIAENCRNFFKTRQRLNDFEERSRLKLGLETNKFSQEFGEPNKISLNNLIKNSDYLFIALHGGEGEDGTLQCKLDQAGVKYNGPGADASRLLMNKKTTADFIRKAKIKNVNAIVDRAIKTSELINPSFNHEYFWKTIRRELLAKTIIVKPQADGCSTGVVHLCSAGDLKKYIIFLKDEVSIIPKNTFQKQNNPIEMPTTLPEVILFQPFIETDILQVKNHRLKYQVKTGWLETTIGVIEQEGKIHAFNPSLAVVEGKVLSVEEKFQGGTGINITPPPFSILKPKFLKTIKYAIEELSQKLEIKGYSRIDAFINVKTGQVLVIEVNTLPALTPSTVFYQQALAEGSPIFPRELLEKLISNKNY